MALINPEHSKIAIEIAKKYPIPLEKLLAWIYGYWQRTKDGKKYFQFSNYMTGEIRTTDSLNGMSPFRFITGEYGPWNKTQNIIVTSPRGEVPSHYAWYHEEYQVLELGALTFHADRKIDKPREWEVTGKCYIFHGDPIAYGCDGKRFSYCEEYMDGKFYNKEFVRWVKDLPGELNPTFDAQVEAFFGKKPESKYHTKWYTCLLAEELKKTTPRQESKRKLTLNDIQLEEVDVEKLSNEHPAQEYVNEYNSNGHYYTSSGIVSTIVKFEIPDTNYCVFRIFTRYMKHDVPKERMRLFIDSKGKPTVMETFDEDEWRISSIPADKLPKGFVPVGFEDMQKFDRLRYISKMVEENRKLDSNNQHNDYCLQLICQILRHPILEMLYKSGYPTFAMYLSNRLEVAKDLKVFFGVKETKKPLYTMLNTNKYVLKWIENHLKNDGVATERNGYYGYSRLPVYLLPYATEVAGCELKFCNEQTINELLDGMCKVLDRNSRDYRYILPGEQEYRYWQRNVDRWQLRELSPENRARMMQIFRIQQKPGAENFLRDLTDTMNLLNNISDRNRPDIDIMHITDPVQLRRIHDLLNEIQAREAAERRALYDAEEKKRQEMLKKKCEKLYEERVNKYAYSDENFMIVVPKDPIELHVEGAALRHCLSGYQSTYSLGDTDILFLRRSSAPDEHFYSIEIKYNRVEQIHGFNNKWLGNDIDAARFMYRYLNGKGISCERIILTNMSVGYSPSSKNVPWNEIIKEVN